MILVITFSNNGLPSEMGLKYCLLIRFKKAFCCDETAADSRQWQQWLEAGESGLRGAEKVFKPFGTFSLHNHVFLAKKKIFLFSSCAVTDSPCPPKLSQTSFATVKNPQAGSHSPLSEVQSNVCAYASVCASASYAWDCGLLTEERASCFITPTEERYETGG